MPEKLEDQIARVQQGMQFPEQFQGQASRLTAPAVPGTVSDTGQLRLPGVPPVPQQGSAGFMPNLKAAFVDDPAVRAGILARELFPDEPNAIQRFGVIDNRIVYIDDTGALQFAEGGNLASRAGQIARFAPETVGGTVGGVLGGPAGAAVGAGLGAVTSQAIGASLNDPQEPVGNLLEVGKEMALAGGGEKLARVGIGVRNRGTFPNLRNVDTASVNALRARIKDATGIDLDFAQASGLTSLNTVRKWAFQYPNEAADIGRAMVELQQGQSADAVQRIIDTMARGLDSQQLGVQGITAADAAIKAAKAARSDATEQLYQAAFRGGDAVDVAPTLEVIDNLLDVAKGSQKTALRRAKSMLMAGKDAPETSLEALHNAKLNIDQMVSGEPSFSAGRASQRQLMQVKESLLDDMSRASPLYDTARQKFADISQQTVNPLEDSIVGTLSRIKNEKAAQVSAKLFSDGTITPGQMRFARMTIEKQPGGRDAWRGIVAQWLDDSLQRAARTTQAGDQAIPGKFLNNVGKTPRQRQNLRIALGGDVLPAFDAVNEAFDLMRRATLGGSDTIPKSNVQQVVAAGQRGAGVQRLAQRPIETMVEAVNPIEGTEDYLATAAVRIAEGLTDPARVKAINKLIPLKGSTEKAIEVFAILGVPTGVRSAFPEPLTGPDQLPGQSQ